MLCARSDQDKIHRVFLTEDELILILMQALVKARKLKSGVPGKKSPQIHVAVIGKGKKEAVVIHSDEDSDKSAAELAKHRSHMALGFSNDDKAMSSRSVAHLVSRGDLKSSIPAIQFPGGFPLYKSVNGKQKLVGAVAVSGDTPDRDEAIALAASANFAAPSHIRSNDTPFHSAAAVEELKVLDAVPAQVPTRRSSIQRSRTPVRELRTPRRLDAASAPLPSLTALPPSPISSPLPALTPARLPVAPSPLRSSPSPAVSSSLPSLPSPLPRLHSPLPVLNTESPKVLAPISPKSLPSLPKLPTK